MRTQSTLMVLGLLLLGAAPLAAEGYPGDKTRLLRLAEKFEDRAFKLLDEALSEHRHPTRQQDAAIEAFRDLAWVSAYYHDQVRVDPFGYRNGADYEILAEAFFRTAGWMNRTRFDRDVHEDFRKLENAFSDLDQYFGARQAYGRVDRRRIDDRQYRSVMKTRVIPRVQTHPRYRTAHPRVRFDVGLRFPNGRIRVVWQ